MDKKCQFMLRWGEHCELPATVPVLAGKEEIGQLCKRHAIEVDKFISAI
jgi:hypothetical protein